MAISAARVLLGLFALPFALVALGWGFRCLLRLADGQIVSRDSVLIISGALALALGFAGPALWLGRRTAFGFGWAAVALLTPLMSALIALARVMGTKNEGGILPWLILAVVALGCALAALLRARGQLRSERGGRGPILFALLAAAIAGAGGCRGADSAAEENSPAELNRRIARLEVDAERDPASVKTAARLNAKRGLCVAVVDASGARAFAPTGGGSGGELVLPPATVILRQGRPDYGFHFAPGRAITLFPFPPRTKVILLNHRRGNWIPHTGASEKLVREGLLEADRE